MTFLLPDEEFRVDVLPNPEHQHHGMSVYMAPTTVTVVHLPTGKSARCDDFRSQIKNYERARTRIEDELLEEMTKP